MINRIVVWSVIVMLSGCAFNTKTYTEDAYLVDIRIFRDDTCEISIDNKRYVDRDESIVFYVNEFKTRLVCRKFPNEHRPSVDLVVSYSIGRDEAEAFRRNKNVFQGAESSENRFPDWDFRISGGDIRRDFKPLFPLTPILGFDLESYQYRVEVDPADEVFIKVLGVARRFRML